MSLLGFGSAMAGTRRAKRCKEFLDFSMPSGMECRRRGFAELGIFEALAEDRDVAVALWREAGLTRPWNDPVADFDLALATTNSTVLIARDGGDPVGTVMAGFDGHRGWVYYLAVSEARRRQGIARALIEGAQQWLAARGCPKVQLMVRGGNAEALRFYAALSYEGLEVVTLGRRLDDFWQKESGRGLRRSRFPGIIS